MYTNEKDTSFLGRVNKVFGLQPLSACCAELTVLVDRGNILELQTLFPVLIDQIFTQWHLSTIPVPVNGNQEDDDTRHITHFLSPCGPLFRVVYTLLKESSLHYEFPITLLPHRLRTILDQHPFYRDLFQHQIHDLDHHNQYLQLNPFDYYIFHFAYYLYGQQRHCSLNNSAVSGNAWNTIYYQLCCDYILHFLPCDPNTIVHPELYYNGKISSSCNNSTNRKLLSPRYQSDLFVNDAYARKSPSASFIEDFAIMQQQHTNAIWRTETILHVFIDFWLCNDSILVLPPINTNMHYSNNTSTNDPITNNRFLMNLPDLPNAEYIRIIRVLAKQLHSFSQSQKYGECPLYELKKCTLLMVQTKFYGFTMNLIQRWPLDGSFRLPLELWLTYIQPWRYPPQITAPNQMKTDDYHLETISKFIDREYLPFITGNLLVYTEILHLILPRFTRADLCSPKMALMLYRITKVFSQTNLIELLREVESSTANTGRPNFDHQNWSLTVGRQKVLDLEGDAAYKPFFTSQTVRSEVCDLLRHIQYCAKNAHEQLVANQTRPTIRHDETANWWCTIRNFFRIPFSGTHSNDDYHSSNDLLKVPAYLDVCEQNLLQIFDVPRQNFIEQSTNTNTEHNNNTNMSSDLLRSTDTNNLLIRQNVRERLARLKYDGDPDLHPIRHNEVAVLVRILYQFASFLNLRYGPIFSTFYYNSSYMGRLARQFLVGPQRIYHYDKTRLGSPRVGTDLPPRISFRNLTRYNFLLLFAFCVICTSYVLRVPLVTACCGVFAAIVLYKCLMAVPTSTSTTSTVRHNYPTEGFGNISFNDSF